jgi:Protein of unknown function (DUF1302)
MRRRCNLTGVLIVLGIVAAAAPAARAQRGLLDGHVSLTTDYFPNVDETVELRARLFVERQVDAGPNLRLLLSGWAEGLLADRPGTGGCRSDGSCVVRDAVARPHQMYVDLRAGRVDVRAGLANVVWGRLDEVQPSDVINPLDLSRFAFEGRTEARLPVPLVRARWFARETLTVEGVWVPFFRRGRVDFLDEESSPFNVLAQTDVGAAGVNRREPARTLGNSQGGVRMTATSGRADWSIAAYRGFDSFGVLLPLNGPRLVERFPRFTMIAGDVEAVRGPWTIRGETAAFFEDGQPIVEEGLVALSGHVIEAGGSLERKAGDYRVNAALLLQHRATERWSETDVSLVTGAQRSFARDTRRLLLFSSWNMDDATAFLRAIGAWSLHDNVWLEGSVGWFAGDGAFTLSRAASIPALPAASGIGSRDFVYLKLKVYF